MIDSKYVTVQVTGHMIHDYKGDFDTLFKWNSCQGQRKIQSYRVQEIPLYKR